MTIPDTYPGYCLRSLDGNCPFGINCRKSHDIQKCECGLIIKCKNYRPHVRGKRHALSLYIARQEAQADSSRGPDSSLQVRERCDTRKNPCSMKKFNRVPRQMAPHTLQHPSSVNSAGRTYPLPSTTITLRIIRENNVRPRYRLPWKRLSRTRRVSWLDARLGLTLESWRPKVPSNIPLLSKTQIPVQEFCCRVAGCAHRIGGTSTGKSTFLSDCSVNRLINFSSGSLLV